MATSPIYSWPEPDNTDLVKNGALAIRTLGNAIDTTMGTMVAKTVVDAKGDLIAGTAADTVNRLAVGNNGETLVADSSTSTGLRYQSAYNGNGLINGAFDIWQRGTSFTPSAGTNTFTADRWIYYKGSGGYTVTRQTSSLNGIQYCLRGQRTSGSTDTTTIYGSYNFESSDSYRFANQQVVYSFYARAGANYSGASNSFTATLYSGTGTDQNITGTVTGAVAVASQAVTLTTSWQRFTLTGTVGATATQIFAQTAFTPTGTAGANDYYEITGIQVEIGSVATTFKRASGGTIQGELAACQRYCYKATVTQTSGIFGNGLSVSSTSASHVIPFPVTMRTNPTLTASGTFSSENTSAYTGTTVALAGNTGSPDKARVNHTTSGMTSLQPMFLCASNDTNAYLLFSSEL